ncbi:MAG: replicative DNA helicase [Chloroflexi bacterium]|nr:replicative DNA helicase [Chloroflexota bacterium]
MYSDRLPPQDIEAEEAVIGSLLIESNALLKIVGFLKPDDFSVERNRQCFQGCVALFHRDTKINQVTLANELEPGGVLEAMGGPAYLSHLIMKVPTSAHVEHYARIVQRTATMRRVIEAGEQIKGIGYEAGPDIDKALTSAEDLLFKIRSGEGTRDFVFLGDVLDQYLEERRVHERLRPDAPDVVPTGFIDLDRLLGGLQRSDLVILAARPSLGKSSLALNIAYNAAKKASAHVAIFSLEMGKEQLADRLLASVSKIDTYKLRQFRQGQHHDNEEAALMAAIGDLSDLQIFVDDTPLVSVLEMRSKARRLYIERGLDLVIVDYLQLMHGGDNRGNAANRVQEVSEISRSLKGLARDLDVPVLALSQLSRAVENRPGKRPVLADLRESGSIEQDADVVVFIFREDAAMSPDDWERNNPERPYPKGVSELIVAKHRHGPTGSVQLFFDEKTTTFKNALVGAV